MTSENPRGIPRNAGKDACGRFLRSSRTRAQNAEQKNPGQKDQTFVHDKPLKVKYPDPTVIDQRMILQREQDPGEELESRRTESHGNACLCRELIT